MCVLYSTERHCEFSVQYREAKCVYCTIERGNECVMYSIEAMCLNFTVYCDTVCVCTVKIGTVRVL